MKFDDVTKTLLMEFPLFSVADEDDLELQYVVAGLFTDYILRAYQAGDKDTYNRGLKFIEKLHTDDTHEVRELATIGYLESIQNTWPKKLINANVPFNDLGEQSKIWWVTLNDYWNGLKGR